MLWGSAYCFEAVLSMYRWTEVSVDNLSPTFDLIEL